MFNRELAEEFLLLVTVSCKAVNSIAPTTAKTKETKEKAVIRTLEWKILMVGRKIYYGYRKGDQRRSR